MAAEALALVRKLDASLLGMSFSRTKRIREGDFAGLLRDIKEIGIGQVE